jgi:hypothetical protein
VKVLMAHLMACAKQGPIEPEQVMSFLDETSLTCKITAEEDKKLRDARLWNAMPGGSWCKQTGLILNQWARYEHPLVAIELEVQP